MCQVKGTEGNEASAKIMLEKQSAMQLERQGLPEWANVDKYDGLELQVKAVLVTFALSCNIVAFNKAPMCVLLLFCFVSV